MTDPDRVQEALDRAEAKYMEKFTDHWDYHTALKIWEDRKVLAEEVLRLREEADKAWTKGYHAAEEDCLPWVLKGEEE